MVVTTVNRQKQTDLAGGGLDQLAHHRLLHRGAGVGGEAQPALDLGGHQILVGAWLQLHQHRFGRFPHRNAVLGQVSSSEDLAFLQTPGSRF